MNIDIQTEHTKVTVTVEADTMTTFFEALIGFFTGEVVRRVPERKVRVLPPNNTVATKR